MKCNIHSFSWFKFSQYKFNVHMEIEMLTNCVLNAINCEGEIEMNYLRNEEEPNSLYFQCICDE